MTNVDSEFIIAGKWKVHSGTNTISASGETVQLQPQIMQLLTYLCNNRNRVVSKDELIREVWKNQVVSENTITQAISKLRRLLGDDPSQPKYIETISKKGYRFIAEITPGKKDEKDTVSPYYHEPKQFFNRSIPLGIGALFIMFILITIISVSLSLDEGNDRVPDSTPLTTRPGIESDPAYSADGQKLAYAWMNPETGKQNIYVKIIGDPSSDLQLTESEDRDSSPAWSQDGNRIMFIRHTSDNCWIYSISSIGGRAQKLTTCGANEYADLTWSPNGQWLAFNDKTGNDSFGIVLFDVNSGEKKILTQPSSNYWGDYDPAFSPDGSRLAFARAFSEGIQDLFVINLNNKTEGPQRITNEFRNIFGLTWLKSADDEQILFSSNRSGTYDLWSVSLTDRKIQSIYKDDRHIVNPDINANNLVVYESRFYDMNIWNYTFSDGPGKTKTSAPLIHSTRWELYPTFSPNERQIAFISDRSGSYELWVSKADGTGTGQLTHFDGPFVSNPNWSPNNSTIVFDARPDGHGNIYRIEASSGKVIPVISHSANDLVPRWSRDGNWIYFASDRTGKWQVWKTSADGKTTEQVTKNGGFSAQESIDGHTLFFTKPNESGLWKMNAEGKTTQILKYLDPGDWGNWQVTNRGIYFIHRMDTDNPIIKQKDLTTGKVVEFFKPGHSIPTHDASFAINKLGDHILLGKREQQESDLLSIQLPK